MKALKVFLLSILIAGCDAHSVATLEGTHMDPPANIGIILNQPIDVLLERHPSCFSTECLAPVNICWYTVARRFSSPNLPSVTIKNDDRTLVDLQHVGNLSIAVNNRRGSEVRDVSLSIRGLPDDSLHSEQKDFIYKVLRQFISNGWVYLYPFSDPRIPGTESHKLNEAKHIFGQYVLSHPWLDPRHEVSIEHWIQSGSTYHWYFHQDGAYLHIRVQSSKSEAEPGERGTYLIQIKLMDESSYWREHFSSEQLNDWQKLLPELLEQYQRERAALEAKARAAGIEIENSYQNPTIKALNSEDATQP